MKIFFCLVADVALYGCLYMVGGWWAVGAGWFLLGHIAGIVKRYRQ